MVWYAVNEREVDVAHKKKKCSLLKAIIGVAKNPKQKQM